MKSDSLLYPKKRKFIAPKKKARKEKVVFEKKNHFIQLEIPFNV